MKWRPILFSGEMVRAILDGRKTETRRVIVPQPRRILAHDERLTEAMVIHVPDGWEWGDGYACGEHFPPAVGGPPCPYGAPDDGLWVREKTLMERHAWMNVDGGWEGCWGGPGSCVEYCADGAQPHHMDPDVLGSPWMGRRPSIHMPKWTCRLFLRVLEVRVERVQDITEEGGRAENCVARGPGLCTEDPDAYMGCRSARTAFRRLWDSINAKRGYGWDANPWVWVVRFERTERPEDWTS